MDNSWIDDYWAGYLLARSDPAEAQRRRRQGDKWTQNYILGLQDGLTGAAGKDPAGVIPPPGRVPPAVRQAPAYTPPQGGRGPTVYIPAPGTPVPVPPPSLVPGGFPVYEVYAHVPIKGGIPLDVAEQIRQQARLSWAGVLGSALVGVTLLGADPADYRQGFRLSGPQGRIAQQVAAAIRGAKLYAYPTSYGLDGWYGAQTTRGIRLIGPQELQALGLQ